MRTQSKYRVLVVRLGAIGDILHALPAVTALRQAHLNWTIDWVVEPKWSALLAAADSTARDTEAEKPRQPLVDNLHFAPTKAWRKQPLSRTTRSELGALRSALREGSWRGAARMVAAMHPAEIANLIESLPPAQREVVWNFVEPEIEGDVLVELSDGVRQAFIEGMDADELLAAAEDLELDDLADLVGDLPEAVGAQLVKSMDAQDRERMNTLLLYEPDTAGGLMNTDTVSVRADGAMFTVTTYNEVPSEVN